ncbi:MAG TPA: DNA polymerase III subunit gamma/tau [Solirubrobacterales bacterium]|nr:DNA polymerase III subunit gamma/tau [Solirubrobacterales bacterium]
MAESASLYRRHRPLSFAEVVGQEHVVRTLSNAVEGDRVHHAYLFVGSRGTGKTSMAKILARSLNCVNGPTLTPCGECESCLTIAAGTSLDVIEMDAASNRSVDDVRELRERVGYAPAEGRWKVYILDEAHMLTKEAWNAFLKTLEEPPPNTVFVLATTEPQKVMATIVDRCQRFDFQRPSLDQIAEVVRRVASAEGIEVEDGAVALTARAASGSFRDALGTLDQLVAFGGERITTGDVVEMLGAADAELLFDVTDALAAGDAAATLEAVERLSRSGRDPGQFARDLIGHLRQLLVTRATGEVPESFTVTVAQPERLAEQAERVDDAKLMGAIDALSTAVANMREGDDPRLSLEVALLKVARPTLDSSREALLRRIESLERKLGSSESQGPASASPRSASQPGTPGGEAEDLPVDESGASASPRTASQPGTRGSEAEDVPIDPSGASASSAAASQAAAPGSEAEDLPVGGEAVNQNPQPNPEAEPHVNLEDVAHLWPAVVDHVRGSGSEMLSTLFEGARPLGVDAERGTLRIGFPPSAKFNKRKAESKPNVERIAESVDAIVGERLRPVYELLDADESEPAEANGAPAMEEEEIIELLKTKFDASEVVGDEGRDEGTG